MICFGGEPAGQGPDAALPPQPDAANQATSLQAEVERLTLALQQAEAAGAAEREEGARAVQSFRDELRVLREAHNPKEFFADEGSPEAAAEAERLRERVEALQEKVRELEEELQDQALPGNHPMRLPRSPCHLFPAINASHILVSCSV